MTVEAVRLARAALDWTKTEIARQRGGDKQRKWHECRRKNSHKFKKGAGAMMKFMRQRGFMECAENPNVQCVAAFALSIAQDPGYVIHSRDMILCDIALLWAKVGGIARALSIAQGIKDVPSRIKVLCGIAVAHAEAGDKQAARRTFDAALSAIQDVKADPRARLLCDIASAQAKSGDRQEAWDTFISALSFTPGNFIACHIAVAQAKAGDIITALAVVQNINNADYLSHRNWALRHIAMAQRNNGNKEGAQNTLAALLPSIRDIRDAHSRAIAYSAMAATQARVGDDKAARCSFAAALVATQRIHSVYSRADAMRIIAIAQEETGNSQAGQEIFAFSLSIARNIDNLRLRAKSLCNIAAAQAQTGNITAALSIAKSIDYLDNRIDALCVIAAKQTERGEAQAALNTYAALLPDAQKIDPASSCAETLCTIAKGQMKAGGRQAARSTFFAALSIARNLGAYRAPSPRSDELCGIALGQASGGEFRDAMKTVMELEYAEPCASAMVGIAEYLAELEKS